MTRDTNEPSRPIQFTPRHGDRRQVNALKGIPLVGGLGLVFNERRSYRERRGARRTARPPAPCALLQLKEEKNTDPAPPRDTPGRWSHTAIGAWIRRRLKNPWRG